MEHIRTYIHTVRIYGTYMYIQASVSISSFPRPLVVSAFLASLPYPFWSKAIWRMRRRRRFVMNYFAVFLLLLGAVRLGNKGGGSIQLAREKKYLHVGPDRVRFLSFSLSLSSSLHPVKKTESSKRDRGRRESRQVQLSPATNWVSLLQSSSSS